VRAVVDTIHTSNAGGAGRRLGYRWSDWLSDELTCVSEAVAETAKSMTPQGKLAIVPNGVGLPERMEGQESRDGDFRWVAVGRLERVKDYPTLIRAVALLEGAMLTIAGSGREEAALRELVIQLGIESRVVFAGFQTEIDGLLRRADGFVLSSLWEGLPVSVLEAQAVGLPVVATDGKGTREAMIAGTAGLLPGLLPGLLTGLLSGLLVPVGDAEALARAMGRIMDMTRTERMAMGAAGRALVEERFSLPVVVHRWQRLYARLMVENPTARRWAR
jgi:glycosyltransferase involved in cell wall biosynthesis